MLPSGAEPQLTGNARVLFVCASLLLLGGVLLVGSPVSQAGHDERIRRNFCLLLIALLGLAVTFLNSQVVSWTESLDRIITVCATLLPSYALFQLLPLPLPLVSLLSPNRAELLKAFVPIAGGQPAFTTLSVTPGVTFTHFVLITGYAVVFFSVRAMVRSAPGSSLFFAVPVLLAATLEGLTGLFQFAAGASAQGTYAVKNHFAGLLVIAVPFSVTWLFSIADNARHGGRARLYSASSYPRRSRSQLFCYSESAFPSRGELLSQRSPQQAYWQCSRSRAECPCAAGCLPVGARASPCSSDCFISLRWH